MILGCKILILSKVLWLTATFVTAFRTENWPPQVIVDAIARIIPQMQECKKEHQTDFRKLDEFEVSTDFDNLPDDRSIKCFILCTYIAFGLIIPGNPKFQGAELFHLMSQMEHEDRGIFLKLGSRCTKLKSKDMCDAVYELNVCMKKNDNEHYYLAYEWEYWARRMQKNQSHDDNAPPVSKEIKSKTD